MLLIGVRLEYFHYFALEQVFFAYGFKSQRAVGELLDAGKEFVAAHPDVVLAVAEYYGDAAEVWRMQDVPLCAVVVQQSFKVSHEHRAVLANLYVEITVVGVVFLCREVADKGKALGSGGADEQ